MKKNIALLAHTPVGIAILKLSVPTVLAMMVQIIYGLTDTFFIGQTGNANLVAAISLALPFNMLLQAMGNIFAFGGGAYISQMLGAKKMVLAKRICASSFYFSILLGMAISLFCWPLLDILLKLLGASYQTWEGTKTYLSILVLCSTVQILQIVLSGLIRSEGATQKAMQGILVGTGLNIILDYLFILRFGWGISGAAWATILGNTGGVLYYLGYFIFSGTLLSLHWKYFFPSLLMIKNIVKIGLPVAFNTTIMSISHILTNNIAISYGEITMAASGIMGRLLAIGVFLQMGIAQGYQPFAGYNFGAKQFDRLRNAFFFTLKISACIGMVIAAVFFIFGTHLVSLFIPNAEVIEKAVIMINAFAWGLPLFAFNFLTSITFQTSNRAGTALVLVVLRQVGIFLPMLYGLNYFLGFKGFIFAQPLSDIPIGFLSCFLLNRFFKNLKKTA